MFFLEETQSLESRGSLPRDKATEAGWKKLSELSELIKIEDCFLLLFREILRVAWEEGMEDFDILD